MTHDELAQALLAAGSAVAAAELHGSLSGALCADARAVPADWAEEILPDHAEAASATAVRQLLEEIIGQTGAALAGGEMTFAPLLPADDATLDTRVAALAEWCGGFLYGIGRCGPFSQPGADLDEILRDFAEIARAAVDEGEQGEEAERDFSELVEFVRASVQLAYEELAPLRARRGSPARQVTDEEQE